MNLNHRDGEEDTEDIIEILCWPESCRTIIDADKNWWVLGWVVVIQQEQQQQHQQHQQQHQQHQQQQQQQQQQHGKITRITIAMDFIPINMDRPIEALQQQQQQQQELNQAIQRIRSEYCVLCSCGTALPNYNNHDGTTPVDDYKNKNPNTRFCRGCQRRTCLDDLRVVGILLDDSSSSFPNRGEENLICLQSRKGVPWFHEDDTTGRRPRTTTKTTSHRGQIVWYDDSLEHSYLHGAQCNRSHGIMGLQQTWLMRMDNAPLIRRALARAMFSQQQHHRIQNEETTPTTRLSHTPTPTLKQGTERTTGISRSEYSYLIHQVVLCFFSLSKVSLQVQFLQKYWESPSSWPLWTVVKMMNQHLFLVHQDMARPKSFKIGSNNNNYYYYILKEEMISNQLEHTGKLLGACANVFSGFFVSAALLAAVMMILSSQTAAGNTSWDWENSIEGWIKFKFQALRMAISWLQNNPMGVKVNAPLAHVFGQVICIFYDSLEWMCLKSLHWVFGFLGQEWMVPKITMLGLVFLPACINGLSGWLALLHDTWRLAAFHVLLLATFFRVLFRLELHILGATWCLFCGQKRNILRHRTDSMDYDSTQLLLGSILFAIVLYLLTTFSVFHFCFEIMRLLIGTVTHVLQQMCQCADCPTILGILYQKMQGWQWYPKSIFLVVVEDHDLVVDKADITHLRTVQFSLFQLLRQGNQLR